QAVERPRARLHHDPPNDRSALRIVLGRSPPHVVEHIKRDLFGHLAVAADAHDQGEHDATTTFVVALVVPADCQRQLPRPAAPSPAPEWCWTDRRKAGPRASAPSHLDRRTPASDSPAANMASSRGEHKM